MTPQEQRDQDYLEGYRAGRWAGVALGRTYTDQELTLHTVAFVRGYRDAVRDREDVTA